MYILTNIRSYTQKKTKSKAKFTYDRRDYDLIMRQDIGKTEWDQIMEGKNLEETWETFEGIMKDAMKKYIPSKKITSGAKQRKTPLWMNCNVMSKIKKKNKAYTQFLNSRYVKDYKEYAKARNQAKRK